MVDPDIERSRTEGEANTGLQSDAQPARVRRRWTPTLVVLAIVVLLTAGTVAVLVFAKAPEDPREAPDRWDSLDFEPEQDIAAAKGTIDLREKGGSDVSVVVHAAEEVCWNGYVISEQIQGCGRAIYRVSNAPPALGLNVRSTSEDPLFLGLAVWDGSGDTKLHSLETKKPFGTLAITVNL